MTPHLHNPVNQAHIEDLKDRLSAHLAHVPTDPYNRSWAPALVGTLADVVRAMDKGSIPVEQVQKVFAAFHIPGFSFEAWLAEMFDEGVYLETDVAQAA